LIFANLVLLLLLLLLLLRRRRLRLLRLLRLLLPELRWHRVDLVLDAQHPAECLCLRVRVPGTWSTSISTRLIGRGCRLLELLDARYFRSSGFGHVLSNPSQFLLDGSFENSRIGWEGRLLMSKRQQGLESAGNG